MAGKHPVATQKFVNDLRTRRLICTTISMVILVHITPSHHADIQGIRDALTDRPYARFEYEVLQPDRLEFRVHGLIQYDQGDRPGPVALDATIAPDA